MTVNQTAGVPRHEYPRPQLVRNEWLNLNGLWDFSFDFGKSGRERGLITGRDFTEKIMVPFCPESELSGIGYKDFIPAVWYSRSFTVPEDWAGKRVMLHFGAVDYMAEVWVNGLSAGTHKGGYSSFSFEITSFLKQGDNTVTICAEDDTRSRKQPRGKQSNRYHSFGCEYTRTTGIWQTVWLEALPAVYISSLRLTPDLQNGRLQVDGKIDGDARGGFAVLSARFENIAVGEEKVSVSAGNFHAGIALREVHPWSPDSPALYDLEIALHAKDGCTDRVGSYFGLRSLQLCGGALLLNDRPIFQRLALDQGFYPDGIYTAPSDEALKKDIEISKGLGFNGARLHQKVFEARFLYWADRLGYMVWGEQGCGILEYGDYSVLENFLPEWEEVLERDFNHPSIICWCPFNETSVLQNPNVMLTVYRLTKKLDPTRPVIDASGWVHVKTDLYDVHDYEQDTDAFRKRYEEDLAADGAVFLNCPQFEKYEGQPYVVSEYGGIWWNPGQQEDKAWGYGKRLAGADEFITRYRELTGILLRNPRICGFCYTQLYDVEQEVNGLYTYGREPKFDPAVIRTINSQKAAIEK